ncbi:hypothetical protein VNI00_011326 [Paramarasmius palmivorus]|uniref:Tyrosinase copper-binding domain-containing protein n=1 Tax=Paramarasmius palmivorus TaxID=297713 RepID=A0AAW0CEC5_9AGAR
MVLPQLGLLGLLSLSIPLIFATPVRDSPLKSVRSSLELEARQTGCESLRVRKEWRELSSSEQAAYHQAVKCLMSTPSRRYPGEDNVVNRADDFTRTHMLVNGVAHFTATFLPFHRWFVLQYETALRSDCGYTGPLPYWDWTIDADSSTGVPNSPLFDASTGFGGNGRRVVTEVSSRPGRAGYETCVTDGPYANTTLTLGRTAPDLIYGEHCLSRTFNNGTWDSAGNFLVGDMMASKYYTTSALAPVFEHNDYDSFEVELENGAHMAIHNALRGDMFLEASPNDPLFYLHHGNVDRIWAKWQAANPARLTDFSGWKYQNKTVPVSLDDELPVANLSDDRPIVKDYMDIGVLCYEYSN